jgi:4-hydroxy-tetrahydrodipicolinate synthase
MTYAPPTSFVTGSWVAIPTPMSVDYSIDYDGFKRLIDLHAAAGTSALLIGGSAGEVSALTMEERREIVHRIAPYAADKLPVFFSASAATTADTLELIKHTEDSGAYGALLTVPAYSLPPQSAVLDYLAQAATAVDLPIAVYNNPSRVQVNITPDTIAALKHTAPNFLYDKEAAPSSSQIVDVAERTGGSIAIFCCDNPAYGLIATTLMFGHGCANITGNLIPGLMNEVSRITTPQRWREAILRALPLMRLCYQLTNPIVIKSALELQGIPCGRPRPPLQPVRGRLLETLRDALRRYAT